LQKLAYRQLCREEHACELELGLVEPNLERAAPPLARLRGHPFEALGELVRDGVERGERNHDVQRAARILETHVDARDDDGLARRRDRDVPRADLALLVAKVER